MLNHHFNSKRPATAIIPEYKASKSGFSYIKTWLFIALCGVLIVTTSGLLTPHTAIAASEDSVNEDYIFDKVLTWHDGSTEHVQIGTDGYFRLDGEKKRLVGMFLSTSLPYGQTGQFWLPENLAILDRELTYLESVGIRLIRIDLRYVRWWVKDISEEEAVYNTLLDLIYKHKMLLVPGIHAKWLPGFGDLENPDFSWAVSTTGQIANSDFEGADGNVPMNWSTYYQDSKPVFLYPELGREAGSSVGITLAKTDIGQQPEAMWLQEMFVEPGTSYPIEGWIKTEDVEGEGGAIITAHWEGPDNKWIGLSNFMGHVKGTSDWTFYQGEVKAPEGAVKGKVCLMIHRGSGKAWFDDIQFGQDTGSGEDSLSEWAGRWSDVVSHYQNVVAVNADNELDYKLQPIDFTGDPDAAEKAQNYTADAVDEYMSLLTGIIRDRVDAPITHNLMLNELELGIKEVALSHIDIPAFDCYALSTSELDSDLTAFLPEMNVSPGWWCMELNHGGMEYTRGVSEWDINTKKFKSDYIDSVFNQGAAVAILFWSTDMSEPDWGFFDNYGEPKVQLTKVAKEIADFQLTMTETPMLLANK